MKDVQKQIEQVKELRAQGLSRAKIIETTGFAERFVREHMQGVEKQDNSKTNQCVTVLLALGTKHIKQHELNNAVYNVYGNKWTGHEWVAAWDRNTVQRVKSALIAAAPGTVIVPNWVDLTAPEESRVMLEEFAIEMQRHITELIGYYVAMHGSPDDTKDAAQQANSAREHVLALAFNKYSAEPVGKLLARSKEVTDILKYGDAREVEFAPDTKPDLFVREPQEEKEQTATSPFCDEWERLESLGYPTITPPAWTTESIE